MKFFISTLVGVLAGCISFQNMHSKANYVGLGALAEFVGIAIFSLGYGLVAFLISLALTLLAQISRRKDD